MVTLSPPRWRSLTHFHNPRYLLTARNLHGTLQFDACYIDPALMIDIQRVLHQGPPLIVMHPHRETPVRDKKERPPGFSMRAVSPTAQYQEGPLEMYLFGRSSTQGARCHRQSLRNETYVSSTMLSVTHDPCSFQRNAISPSSRPCPMALKTPLPLRI